MTWPNMVQKCGCNVVSLWFPCGGQCGAPWKTPHWHRWLHVAPQYLEMLFFNHSHHYYRILLSTTNWAFACYCSPSIMLSLRWRSQNGTSILALATPNFSAIPGQSPQKRGTAVIATVLRSLYVLSFFCHWFPYCE